MRLRTSMSTCTRRSTLTHTGAGTDTGRSTSMNASAHARACPSASFCVIHRSSGCRVVCVVLKYPDGTRFGDVDGRTYRPFLYVAMRDDWDDCAVPL